MNLHRVREGKYLHWSKEIDGKDKLWLGPGGIVDLDDPFVASLIVGQEYKVEHDANAKDPSLIGNSRYHRVRATFLEKFQPPPPLGAPVDPERPAIVADIPKPDLRVKREEKKNASLASPVS